MLDLAVRKYPPFDIPSARMWLSHALTRNDAMLAVGPTTIGVASWQAVFWAPKERLGRLIFLLSDGTQRIGLGLPPAYHMLRYMIDWAKAEGCSSFEIDGETVANLTPLARKLGAKLMSPQFRLDLSHG